MYLQYFGFKKEPFTSDICTENLIANSTIEEVVNRVNYVIRLGSIGIFTGDVGCGKSTALRYAAEQLHPSQYKIIWVTATDGSIMEFYRCVAASLGVEVMGSSKSYTIRVIKKEIRELVLERRQQPVIFLDEANLLRTEVFSALHTLTQFQMDSKPWLPMIMAGQDMLIDKFSYLSSRAMASRVVAKLCLKPLEQGQLRGYLQHHLEVAGVNQFLFEDSAINAIYQISKGIYRKTNHLARGALIAAASDKSSQANQEHVRLAETELL